LAAAHGTIPAAVLSGEGMLQTVGGGLPLTF
jgi:hypothetical protein